MVAVASTVGDIDDEFKDIGKSQKFSKGQEFGKFNLGSTIVLIFEAPKLFQLKPIDTNVKMGNSLSKEN